VLSYPSFLTEVEGAKRQSPGDCEVFISKNLQIKIVFVIFRTYYPYEDNIESTLGDFISHRPDLYGTVEEQVTWAAEAGAERAQMEASLDAGPGGATATAQAQQQQQRAMMANKNGSDVPLPPLPPLPPAEKKQRTDNW
jgi:hypothetical protein